MAGRQTQYRILRGVITRSPAMQTLMNTYSDIEVPIIVPALITVAQPAD
jgi:hypothetical protein